MVNSFSCLLNMCVYVFVQSAISVCDSVPVSYKIVIWLLNAVTSFFPFQWIHLIYRHKTVEINWKCHLVLNPWLVTRCKRQLCHAYMVEKWSFFRGVASNDLRRRQVYNNPYYILQQLQMRQQRNNGDETITLHVCRWWLQPYFCFLLLF